MASRVDLRTFRLVEESFPGEWKAYISMPSAWRNYGETWEGFGKTFGYQLVCGKFSTEEAATAACDKAARETSMEEWDQAVREQEEGEQARQRRLAAWQFSSSWMDYPTEPEVTDYLNTPTSGPEDILRNIEDAIRSIETKSQKQTHAWPLVGSVGDPVWVKAPTEQGRKITHVRNTYEEFPLQVKSAERQVISSDFVDPALMVYTGTEANDQDWRSGVICNGGKGAGDPLAADFEKQKNFKDLSQPGLANKGIVPTRTCAGTPQNLQNGKLLMNGGWMESISPKLRKTFTRLFRGVYLVITKMILSMIVFDNFLAKVGATAPGPAGEGTLQAANSNSNTSNLAFGIVGAIGVLFTIIGVFLSMRCRWRRPSPVRTEERRRPYIVRTVERGCYEKVVEEVGV